MAATSIQPRAATASVCNSARGARSRTSAATSTRGCTEPTSLLTSITDTNPTSGPRASASASRSTTPDRSTGTIVPPTASQALRTAWCSTAVHITVPRPDPCTPRTARLSDSVPPEVNTTSPASHPRHCATTSRASSIATWTRRAAVCEPDGLPKCSVRYGSIAANDSGRIGVVAAWSRYACINQGYVGARGRARGQGARRWACREGARAGRGARHRELTRPSFTAFPP